MYLLPFIILTHVFLGGSLPTYELVDFEEEPSYQATNIQDLEEELTYPVENIQDLEEDPSYPVANIQEALSHLSLPLAAWLEEQEANFNSLQHDQLEKELATQGTEKQEMRKRRSVGEGDFQQALCEVNERMFRPRAARRSTNFNDTQVVCRQIIQSNDTKVSS